MHASKVVVIGSGVAGLSIATRLAVKGYKVDVFEKNSYPGGKLSAFENDGFHFDSGPSLFTQPQNIEELFALANEPIGNYFAYQPVDVACKYFFENGKQVNAYTNPQLFAQEMKEQLNENPQSILNYLTQSEKLYDNTGRIFLDHSLHKIKTWFKGPGKALSTIKFRHLFQSLHQYNCSHFTSPEAIQLFNRFATYNGSSPYKAPAILSVIPHLELNQGTYYPKGGMISITNALLELAKNKGVQFHFDSLVQRIIHHEGKARGIVVNDENILADIVISNSDVYFTYKNLLHNATKAKKILRQERSSSAVIFYWGIKKQFDQLGLHNIFFSKDYKKEFDCIFNKKELSNDPTVYINITAKMEKSQSPPGTENWFLMVNASADSGQDWTAIKQQLREDVLNKLSRILGEDVQALIQTEQTSDPIVIQEQTNSFRGSLYGSSSNSRLAAFLRHPNFTSSIKDLYFCGGSVHPGGGIPLCLKSAKIVSELIAAANKKATH
ncbi:MAG: 1-hydroxycarotenoid 3,4-desaturase CrtD [Ferruginibacter sp.]